MRSPSVKPLTAVCGISLEKTMMVTHLVKIPVLATGASIAFG